MRGFRFHVGSLLILVLLLGVGFAALREANDLWDSLVLSAAVGVLLGSILLAAHRKAERRAFWAGFALFGWSYVGLTAMPSIEPRLLTTRALAYLASKVPDLPLVMTSPYSRGYTMIPAEPVWSVAFSGQGNLVAGGTSAPSVLLWDAATGKLLLAGGYNSWSFMQIGHSLCALILAWLGGNLSRHLYLRNRE